MATIEPETEAKNLRDIALFISGDVGYAMQASVVIHCAASYFGQDQNIFATNPTNTLAHVAVHALEDRSIVHISEYLADENRLFPISATIRGKAELVMHRNVVSHPATIKWRSRGMQPFADGHRQWRDLRVAFVWDAWRSIIERLAELGQAPRSEPVTLSTYMPAMLQTILRMSLKPELLPRVPDEPSLLRHLTSMRDQLLDFVVEHPDGSRE